MKIIIKGFKCHHDSEYLFKDGSLILLSGPSGSGKSTIFQAINWCLFGNVRGIYPNSLKTSKTSVTLELNTCSIYRQGRPNLLRIVYLDMSNTTYEDAVAQQIIDRMFGTKDLWKACGYIEQNSRCALLSGSNNERMDLLNQLSFSTDDPEACISRIDVELKSLSQTFSNIQAIYTSGCETLTKELTDYPVDPNSMEYIPQIPAMKDRLPVLVSQLKKLELERMEQMKQIGVKRMLEAQLEKLQQELTLCSPTFPQDVKTISSIEDLKLKIQSDTEFLSKLRQDHIDFVQVKSTATHIIQDLQATELQLSELPSDRSFQLSKLDQDISELGKRSLQLESYLAHIQRRDSLTKQLHQLEMTLSSFNYLANDLKTYLDRGYVDQDVWKTQQDDKIYSENNQVCQQLGITYSQESIDSEREKESNKLKFTQELEHRIQILKQIQRLEYELNSIPEQDRTLSIDEQQVYQARDRYMQLQQSADVLQCPHCSQSVRYVDKTLQVASTKPVSDDEIKLAMNIVSELYGRMERQKKAEAIKSQIQPLLLTCGDRNELERIMLSGGQMSTSEIYRKISILEKIKVVSKPEVPSQFISCIISYKKCLSDLNEIPVINEDVNEEMSSIQRQLTQYRQESLNIKTESMRRNDLGNKVGLLKTKLDDIYRTWKQRKGVDLDLNQDVKGLESMISGLQQDINETKERLRILEKYTSIQNNILVTQTQLDQIKINPNLDMEFEWVRQEIKNVEQLIHSAQYAERMMSKQQDLQLKRDEIMNMYNQLTDLQNFRQLAIDVECQQLQATVDSINNGLAGILDVIFTEPITVQIKLYKQLKTDKRIKPSINLSITYRGCEYDNINSLSGGEGDRISFALTLALSQVSPSNVILLDESMSSLNSDLREACIRTIRDSIGSSKTVIVINHEDVVGYYDHVINV